jgi:hypothetical protein
VETPEEMVGEITQEVLSIRIILRISWIKTNMFFCYNYKYLQIICRYYKKVFSKYLDKKNNREDQGNKREYTRITRVILINKIKNSNSYIYYC